MFMGFGLVLVIGAIAAAAFTLGWLPLGQKSAISATNGDKSPHDIARERYARGEIGKEEYTQIRRDLIS